MRKYFWSIYCTVQCFMRVKIQKGAIVINLTSVGAFHLSAVCCSWNQSHSLILVTFSKKKKKKLKRMAYFWLKTVRGMYAYVMFAAKNNVWLFDTIVILCLLLTFSSSWNFHFLIGTKIAVESQKTNQKLEMCQTLGQGLILKFGCFSSVSVQANCSSC